jgi:hypothetical protein
VSLPVRLPAAALLAVVTVGLAGCGDDVGGGSLSQAQDYAKHSGSAIAADARKAMRSLDTMHVAGELSQDGNTVSVDLSVSGTGECSGTIGVGAGSIELRSVGGRAWYRADEAFWRVEAPDQAAEIARKVHGRWVPLAGQLASLRSFCSIDTLTDQMLSSSATIEAAGAAMVGTRPVVRLAVEEGGTTTTAYVDAAEPHHVLRMTRGKQGDLAFSDFDEKFTVDAPDPKDVFKLKKLD